ncbi:MAG TPA: hypothetical protein VKQ54_06405 [Caulobacteraceae bacterium]|nr:hypothetical protein [Caulobacteraceae bacterium]
MPEDDDQNSDALHGRMDEADRRIRSYELALTAVAAHIDRDHIVAALISIGEELFIGVSDDERRIIYGAILLLNAALDRSGPPDESLRWSEEQQSHD